METKEYKLLDGRIIRAKYDRLGMCKISEENLEAFTKEFNASFRQAKILEKIKENYALIKADERKKGHWIMTNDYFTGAYGSIDYVKCSCCGEESLEEGNFCPNCGAYMGEVGE